MKQPKSTTKKPSLDELVFGALSQLQTLGYNGRSIRRYQATWNRLVEGCLVYQRCLTAVLL